MYKYHAIIRVKISISQRLSFGKQSAKRESIIQLVLGYRESIFMHVRGQYTRENGKGDLEMGMESCLGQMGQVIQAIGKIIMLLEKESLCMQVVTYMMDSGLKIKLLVLGYIIVKMEGYIQDIGSLISRMDMGLRYGMMDLNMKGVI